MPGIIALGITGQTGFIGSHLAAAARRDPRFRLSESGRTLFGDPEKFRRWVRNCDAVVHFAGLSRHADGESLYRVNMRLTEQLAEALSGQLAAFGSTTHDAKDTPYHRSKRDGAARLQAADCRALILRMPNTFGPGSRPFYNSVVSTFCALAAEGKTPDRIDDAELRLIDAETLVREILDLLAAGRTGTVTIPHRFTLRLPVLWEKLQALRSGGTPDSADPFDRTLAETFAWYRGRALLQKDEGKRDTIVMQQGKQDK